MYTFCNLHDIHLMLSSFLPLPVKNPGEELVHCIRSPIQLLERFTEHDKYRYEYNGLVKLACGGLLSPSEVCLLFFLKLMTILKTSTTFKLPFWF